MKRVILVFALLISAAIFAYFAYYLLSDNAQNIEFENTYKEVQNIAFNSKANSDLSPAITTEGAEPPAIDFDALRAINPDTVAWLEIPGTSINFPVVQREDGEFYENHDFNGKRAACGAIFAQSDNSFPEPFSQNTVLYGHNMSSSSSLMFSSLRNYRNKGFMGEHRRINLYTPAGHSKWQVVAVCHLSIDVLNDFNFIQSTFDSNEAYLEHVEQLQSRSMHGGFDVPATESDLLTLVTCDRKTYGKKGRLIVVAMRVSE